MVFRYWEDALTIWKIRKAKESGCLSFEHNLGSAILGKAFSLTLINNHHYYNHLSRVDSGMTKFKSEKLS